MANWPLNRRDCASCPMATKAPATRRVSVTLSSLGSWSSAPIRPESSCNHLATARKGLMTMFGSRCARSSMRAEALNVSLRCTTVTLLAKRAKNSASSSAVSPPPITATSSSMYKAPSQTAQVETPLPFTSSSPGAPSHRADAPVAMITASASTTDSSASKRRRKGRFDKSTAETICSATSAPNRSACLRRSSIISGPETASG
mmetsp:Transcript_96358/g.272529  ORF Transcript_96358/g.272529 Transcript_96358/m.272529 type:complete len:203 (+) Transcript_96358:468-1076(+)